MVVFYFIEEEIWREYKRKSNEKNGRAESKDTSVHLPNFATPRVDEFSKDDVANPKYPPSYDPQGR